MTADAGRTGTRTTTDHPTTDRPSRRAVLGTAAGAGVAGLFGSAALPRTTSPVRRRLFTALPVASGVRRDPLAVGDTVAHRLALTTPDGATAGGLVVDGRVLAVRGAAVEPAQVQHHLLRLSGGTVAALGTVAFDGTGEFVVVGGTGGFRGATGSYLLQPGPGAGSTLDLGDLGI